MDSRELLSSLKETFAKNGSSCVTSGEFLKNVLAAVQACRVPGKEEFDERPATYADFSDSWRSTTSNVLSFLAHLFQEVKTVANPVDAILNRLSAEVVVLVAEQTFDLDQPWVVTGAEVLCCRVEQALGGLFQVETVDELLAVSVSNFGFGKKAKIPLHAACLDLLKVQFAEERWKANPAVGCAFTWVFTRIKFPNLFPALEVAFTPLVRLLDDFVAENQVLGLRCVKHLLDNVTATEISWNGRRDVLARLVYLLRLEEDINAQVLRQECIVALLSVAVKSAATDDFSFELVNEIDERFEEVLNNAKVLQPTSTLRTMLIGFISKYLEIYGIHGVRYTDIIMEMLLESVAMKTRDDRARQVALEALVDVLQKHLWPVLSPRIPDILAAVVVCCQRSSPKPGSQMEKLLRRCVELCFELNPRKFQKVVKDVDLKSDEYRLLDISETSL